jgi:glycosyltransferase involved in cell wall biosynthesis
VHVIANGFDDEVLEQARSAAVPARPDGARLMLLHSGVLSPLERNPENLFLALADLKREGLVSARTLEVVLRASGGEDGYHRRLAELDIADVVRLEPPVPYRDALAEICAADGLLLLQTVGCNAQIPAKAYEYLVARRPILGLVDPAGDTGRLLERVGVRDIAALEDRDRVRRALGNFLAGLRRGDVRVPEEAQTARLSRRARAAEMAAVLDEVGSV